MDTPHIRHFSLKVTQRTDPDDATYISMQLIDEQTKQPISDAEVYAAFAALNATGLRVKRRYNPLAQAFTLPHHPDTGLIDANLPGYGVIEQITPTHVVLAPPTPTVRFEDTPPPVQPTTRIAIPRTEFHHLYELD